MTMHTKLKGRIAKIEGQRAAQRKIKQLSDTDLNQRLSLRATWGGTITGNDADTRNKSVLDAMRMGMPPDQAIRFAQRMHRALQAMNETDGIKSD